MTQINTKEGYKCKYNYILLKSDDDTTDSADEDTSVLYGINADGDREKVRYVNDEKKDSYEYIWLSEDEVVSEDKGCLKQKEDCVNNVPTLGDDSLEDIKVENDGHKSVIEVENTNEVIGQVNEKSRCEDETAEQLVSDGNEFLQSDWSPNQYSERDASKPLNENGSISAVRETDSEEVLSETDGLAPTRNINDAVLTQKPDIDDQVLTKNYHDFALTRNVSDQALTRTVSDPVLTDKRCDQVLTRNASDPVLAKSICDQAFTGNVYNQALTRIVSDTVPRNASVEPFKAGCIEHDNEGKKNDGIEETVEDQGESIMEHNSCLNNKYRTSQKMKAVVVDNDLFSFSEENNKVLSVEKISEMNKDDLLLVNKKSGLLLGSVERKEEKRDCNSRGKWCNCTVDTTKAKIPKYLNIKHGGKTQKVAIGQFSCQASGKISAEVKNKESIESKVPVTSSRKRLFKKVVKTEQDIVSELCPAFDKCALNTVKGAESESSLKMTLNKPTNVDNVMDRSGKQSYKFTKFRRKKSLFGASLTNIGKERLTGNGKEMCDNSKEKLSKKTKGRFIDNEKGLWIRKDNVKEEFWIRKDEALYGLKKVRNIDTKVNKAAAETEADDIDKIPECDSKYRKQGLRDSNDKVSQFDRLLVTNAMKDIGKPSDIEKMNEASANPAEGKKISKNAVVVTSEMKDKKLVNVKDLLNKKIKTKLLPKSKKWMRFMPTPSTGKLLKGELKESLKVTNESLNLPEAEMIKDLKNVYDIENLEETNENMKQSDSNVEYFAQGKAVEVLLQTESIDSDRNVKNTEPNKNTERLVEENHKVSNNCAEIIADSVKASAGEGTNSGSCPDTVAEKLSKNTVGDNTEDSEHFTKHHGNTMENGAVKLKRKNIRRKPVKVLSTRNGIKKIALRYPCKYCGHLFSISYVRLHEKKHGKGGKITVYCRHLQNIGYERNDDDKINVDSEISLSSTRNDSLAALSVSQNSTVDSSFGRSGEHLIENSCSENSKAIPTETDDKYSRNTGIVLKTGSDQLTKDTEGMTKVRNRRKRKSQAHCPKMSENGSHEGHTVETEQSPNSLGDDSLQLQCSSEKIPDNKNANQVKVKVQVLDKNGNPPIKAEMENKSDEMLNVRYNCSECSYSCLYKNILKRHLNMHKTVSEVLVTCKCGIAFRNRLMLFKWHKRNNISHQGDYVQGKVVRRKRQTTSKVINLPSKSRRISRKDDTKKANTKKARFVSKVVHKRIRKKCEKCNFRFNNLKHWEAHKKLHENNNGYTCKECNITMKTKFSLVCWHHRNGIYHLKGQKKVKSEVPLDRKESLYEPGNQNQEIAFQVSNILEAENCTEFGVKDTKHVFLKEKLDGTVYETCSPKLQEAESETAAATFSSCSEIELITADAGNESNITVCNSDVKNVASNMRENINNSLKVLTLKFSDHKKDKPRSHRFKKLEERTNDSNSDVVNCPGADKEIIDLQYDNFQMNKNVNERLKNVDQSLEHQDEMENKRFEVDTLKKTSLDYKDVPVYPLVRKLNLRDGETVYNTYDNEIEVFEKESDVAENYRKIKVFNIDTEGCLEKLDIEEDNVIPHENASSTAEIDENGRDETLENEPLRRNEIFKVIPDKPIDLSVKRAKEGNDFVEENPTFSFTFEIQIDLERKDNANCRPATQQICSSGTSTSNKTSKPNAYSVGAKVVVKNLKVMENVQGRNFQKETRKSEQNGVIETGLEDKNIYSGIEIMTETSTGIESEEDDISNQLILEKEKDVFTFTDDENDDVLYYASKLQEKTSNDDYPPELDMHTDNHFDNLGANTLADTGEAALDTGEAALCDTGETDENNNRTQREQKKSTDRNNESTGGEDNSKRNTGYSGGGERDDDGDEKENDDKNNDKSERDENYNVELLPCLVCQETFNNKTELLKHLSKIHRLTNMCQICYFDEGEIRRFANAVSLRNHKVRDHPEDMVKCVCGAMLIDNKMLSSHLKKFKCNIYDVGDESNEMVKCICGKRFASQQLLLNHRSKCRKRHCLDDPFLEYMSNVHKEKKRCLTTSTAENVQSTESAGMTLRAKLTDSNNNMSMSEDSDNSHGRISKVRRCKGNIIYSEKLYDKFFETAVDLSKKSRRKSYSEEEYTRRYERLPAAQRMSHTDEVLDLRTKPVRDRNNNTLFEKAKNDGDPQNRNNYTPQENWTVSSHSLKSDCNYDQTHNNDSVLVKERDKTDLGSDVKLTFKRNSFDNKKRQNSATSSLSQSLTDSTKKLKTSDIDVQGLETGKGKRTETGIGKRRKKLQPDPDGKYPCKICRRRYKRPYLYTHQKIAHAKKQWILVPTASLQKKPDEKVKYRCCWCRFVCVHWRTAVRHHYTQHQQKELDFISLTSVPEVFSEGYPWQYQDNSVFYFIKDRL